MKKKLLSIGLILTGIFTIAACSKKEAVSISVGLTEI